MKNKAYPTWFAGGALLLYGVFVLVPALLGFGFSFTDWNSYSSDIHWVGLDNFAAIFDPTSNYLSAIQNTVLFTVATIALKTVIALALLAGGCSAGNSPPARSVSGTIETDEARPGSRYGGRVEKIEHEVAVGRDIHTVPRHRRAFTPGVNSEQLQDSRVPRPSSRRPNECSHQLQSCQAPHR